MKLETIANSILQEAEMERKKILTSAQNEVTILINNKKSEFEGINLEKLTQTEQEIEKMVIENVASKRLNAKRDVQKAKDQVIMKAMIKFRDKFYLLKSDEKIYSSLLKKMYSQSLDILGSEDVNIFCSKEDKGLIEKIFPKKAEILISKDISAGFIIKSKVKKMQIDFTFETLLKDKELEIMEVLSRNIF